jgi:glutamate synthase domain-containing protein 3
VDRLTAATVDATARTFDLAHATVRELNQFLHRELPSTAVRRVTVENPGGRHAIAAGLDVPVEVDVRGHGGYYLAGMNQHAHVTVHGNVGWGVAENMMSGSVRVKGFASEAAGASGHGGTLVIEGDASLRCGISMKGIDIVVGGSIGNYSAFMAQAGRLVVCGDAGDALGDSLYEARLFVRGSVASLGADCIEKPVKDEHKAVLHDVFKRAGLDGTIDPSEFRRYGSARKLYNFHVDHAGAY